MKSNFRIAEVSKTCLIKNRDTYIYKRGEWGVRGENIVLGGNITLALCTLPCRLDKKFAR